MQARLAWVLVLTNPLLSAGSALGSEPRFGSGRSTDSAVSCRTKLSCNRRMEALGTIESRIHELEARRTKALIEADVETLDRLTSDDYIHVESNGMRRTKAEFLRDLAAAVYRFDEFVIDENEVVVAGDVAWAVGRYHNIVRRASGAGPVKIARHLRIWACRNGEWRNVMHQATEIVAP